MLLIACQILVLRWSKDSILSKYGFLLVQSHRNESSGVKSGDVEGKLIVAHLQIKLLLCFLEQCSITVLELYTAEPLYYKISEVRVVARIVAHSTEESICIGSYQQNTHERNKALSF